MSCELSVVVPTFNERPNVRPLVRSLERVLGDIPWEIIFVDDDSPDGTAAEVESLAAENPRVRLVRRIGRRGLASACVEGMLTSLAPFFAVIDADMQHDEALLPGMLAAIKRDNLDIVSGSRFLVGGSTGELARSRARLSALANALGRFALKTELTDPMSGFFVVRREFLERHVHGLSAKGFKILLDLFMAANGDVRFQELPYRMRTRHFGDSKLDSLVVWEYLVLLADKLIGWLLPVKFVLFVLVGLGGAGVHLMALGLAYKMLDISFVVSQATATFMAMTLNYVVNNLLTYRDMRQRGGRFWSGLVKFYVACSIGAGVSVLLAEFLFGLLVPWWLAGLLGAIVGAVWNFAVTSAFIWNRPKAHLRKRESHEGSAQAGQAEILRELRGDPAHLTVEVAASLHGYPDN